jgi:hypothetical protein
MISIRWSAKNVGPAIGRKFLRITNRLSLLQIEPADRKLIEVAYGWKDINELEIVE